MEVNFRYMPKGADTLIRGVLFRAGHWLETEARIPLAEAEEGLLKIEAKVGDTFIAFEEVIEREVQAAGHLFGKAEQAIEAVIEKVEAVIEKAEGTPAIIVEDANEAIASDASGATASDEPAAESPSTDEPQA